MKAIVTKAYTDKNDKKLHYVGESVTLTAERANELAAGGYVRIGKTVRKAKVEDAKAEEVEEAASEEAAEE